MQRIVYPGLDSGDTFTIRHCRRGSGRRILPLSRRISSAHRRQGEARHDRPMAARSDRRIYRLMNRGPIVPNNGSNCFPGRSFMILTRGRRRPSAERTEPEAPIHTKAWADMQILGSRSIIAIWFRGLCVNCRVSSENIQIAINNCNPNKVVYVKLRVQTGVSSAKHSAAADMASGGTALLPAGHR